jgi:biopolymer transport protein ExbD
VPRSTLQARLDQQTENDHEQRVFQRADGTLAYNALVKVMNLLRDAG